MARHGRVLIPSKIRGMLNILPGDKVNLEIYENEVQIISANRIMGEIHAVFTKKQKNGKNSVVGDFIKRKREEYKIEETRSVKND